MKIKVNDVVMFRDFDGNECLYHIKSEDDLKCICMQKLIAVWHYDDSDDEEKSCEPVEPTKIDYDKYIALEHENEELKAIIVELNKKLYVKNN